MSLLRQLTNCALLPAVLFFAASGLAQPTQWEKAAAELAHRIADRLGPSSAHLTVNNVSGIANDAVPGIRRLLTDDLKAAGVTVTSGESANAVRVTLSENVRGGLWVAEIVEGNQTRVVMVAVERAAQAGPAAMEKVALHVQPIARASQLEAGAGSIQPIVAAAMVNGELAVLFPSRMAVFGNTQQGWMERAHADFGAGRSLSRDPRGVIVPLSNESGFEAFAPGVACTGESAGAAGSAGPSWTLHCHASDDPWPLAVGSVKAFYNAGRDFFTGAMSPSPGVDLPSFYTAGLLPNRTGGAAVLLESTEGKVLLAEGGALKPVAGTRDWGSDFAVVTSGCGAGAQVIVSASGEGKTDSLRSYEIPAQEAVAVSEPLALPGPAMALWPAPDMKSALAIVRRPAGAGQSYDYEVDSVTQSCN
jgi:hypothetical protein